MNRDQRKFGRLLTENTVVPELVNTKLKTSINTNQKTGKRISENDVCDVAKRQKGDKTESEEQNPNQCKAKKDSDKEPHVRKLDLGDDVPQRITRSSVHKLRFSTECKVDPAILAAREGVDFGNPETFYRPPKNLPPNVEDFDRIQLSDISSEPHFAYDVFEYYREKEAKYLIPKYMHHQTQVTRSMRTVLIDWMVEVQESFELNHETLYLAVKLVDHYLSKKVVAKDRFQLLGTTCLLISAKYDERIPPSIEDFLYICDDAYTKKDIIAMEMEVLRRLDFCIGYPISYRFLRRFGRTARISMETLTLARYILETSLLEYDFVSELDSKMAAASLILALKMKDLSWGPDLVFYSGYSEHDLISIASKLNDLISAPVKSNTKTIRSKYSHQIFFEVAKIAPLSKTSSFFSSC